MKVEEVDHICFAVRSLDHARKFYEEILGLKPSCEYLASEEAIRVVRYYVGGVAVELLEPTSSSSEVAKFIDKRGEGFFLISYRVDDVDAALHELRAAGRRTIDDRPRTLFGNRYAFIQPPPETHGVLTEILDGRFEPPPSDKRETSD